MSRDGARRRFALGLLAGTALLARAAWADGAGTPPALAPAAPERAATPDPRALVFGEFTVGADAVVDGDTIRLASGAGHVRVLGVDCEEVFLHAPHDPRGEADRFRATQDFPAYARAKRGESPLPVKYGTPAGVEAQRFTREWFQGVTSVRLERDEEGRDHDGFGRILAHVFATKDGHDALLSEAIVRAGWAPYFVKYGRSKRFDARLRAAQEEARAARRGIWGDAIAHYPDYPERLAWWEERAKQVDAWEADVAAHPLDPTRVTLGVESQTARLESLVGKRVTVFGALDRVDADEPAASDPAPRAAAGRRPKILWIVDRPRRPLAVVVWSDDVWRAIDLGAARRRFLRASGTLQRYKDRLEVRLDAASDLSTP